MSPRDFLTHRKVFFNGVFLSGYLAWCRGILVSSGKPPRYLLPHLYLLGVVPRQDHLGGYWPWPRRRSAALPPRKSRLPGDERCRSSQPQRLVSARSWVWSAFTAHSLRWLNPEVFATVWNLPIFPYFIVAICSTCITSSTSIAARADLSPGPSEAMRRCTGRQQTVTWQSSRCCSMPRPLWMPRAGSAVAPVRMENRPF